MLLWVSLPRYWSRVFEQPPNGACLFAGAGSYSVPCDGSCIWQVARRAGWLLDSEGNTGGNLRMDEEQLQRVGRCSIRPRWTKVPSA